MMMLVMFIRSNCFLQNPSLINRKFTTNLKVIDEQYFNRPGIWDEKNLDKWLAKPSGFAPGNKMGFAGIDKKQDRVDLIAYLKANS